MMVTRCAKFLLHFVALGFWLEGILRRLKVKQRSGAARPPFVLADGGDSSALTVADFRMPSGQPDRGVIARSKERKS